MAGLHILRYTERSWIQILKNLHIHVKLPHGTSNVRELSLSKKTKQSAPKKFVMLQPHIGLPFTSFEGNIIFSFHNPTKSKLIPKVLNSRLTLQYLKIH